MVHKDKPTKPPASAFPQRFSVEAGVSPVSPNTADNAALAALAVAKWKRGEFAPADRGAKRNFL